MRHQSEHINMFMNRFVWTTLKKRLGGVTDLNSFSQRHSLKNLLEYFSASNCLLSRLELWSTLCSSSTTGEALSVAVTLAAIYLSACDTAPTAFA
jgi:hypothetical protein